MLGGENPQAGLVELSLSNQHYAPFCPVTASPQPIGWTL